MLALLVFLAALSAEALPVQGRYLLATQNDTGMIVFDQASLTNTGGKRSARVITALARGQNVDGHNARVVQFIEEYDCGQRATRLAEVGVFSDAGLLMERDPSPGEWSKPPAGSGRERSLQHVCDGKDMPLMGTDLMTVLRAYWSGLPRT